MKHFKNIKKLKIPVWISMDVGRLPKVKGALGKAWGSLGT